LEIYYIAVRDSKVLQTYISCIHFRYIVNELLCFTNLPSIRSVSL